MRSILFILACFVFVFLFSPRPSEAQCSRGACGPAVVQFWAPGQGAAHVGIVAARAAVVAAVAPVRVVARVAVAVHERKPVRAAVRRGWFRGCR